MKVAIFASGNGSNFEVLAKEFIENRIPGELKFLFCDQQNAFVIERAKNLSVPYFVIARNKDETKLDYEKKILRILETEKIDLIVLAGYMKIIGKTLLDVYPNRIINIHPSLLPKFPGKSSIQDAYESNEPVTGITIHLVDSGIDSGPIIFQKSLETNSVQSIQELETKIHELEHTYYPKVLTDFIRGTTTNDK